LKQQSAAVLTSLVSVCFGSSRTFVLVFWSFDQVIQGENAASARESKCHKKVLGKQKTRLMRLQAGEQISKAKDGATAAYKVPIAFFKIVMLKIDNRMFFEAFFGELF